MAQENEFDTARLRVLNEYLLRDLPDYRRSARAFADTPYAQRRLLRSLMNVRPPLPLDEAFLKEQDALLSAEREQKGVVEATALPGCARSPRLAMWQGDITRLRADAIVNAANSALLGCFCPCHGCIDNAIHSAAGLQLRAECAALMQAQGSPEPAGRAKITRGYNLPAAWVLHTVGPIVRGRVSERDKAELAACYRSCLALAAEKGLQTVAFCCISTGEFHFPNRLAAEIAVGTVEEYLAKNDTIKRVIFNVFLDKDAEIYRELLGPDTAAG